jgi:hypothetical protein
MNEWAAIRFIGHRFKTAMITFLVTMRHHHP